MTFVLSFCRLSKFARLCRRFHKFVGIYPVVLGQDRRGDITTHRPLGALGLIRPLRVLNAKTAGLMARSGWPSAGAGPETVTTGENGQQKAAPVRGGLVATGGRANVGRANPALPFRAEGKIRPAGHRCGRWSSGHTRRTQDATRPPPRSRCRSKPSSGPGRGWCRRRASIG